MANLNLVQEHNSSSTSLICWEHLLFSEVCCLKCLFTYKLLPNAISSFSVKVMMSFSCSLISSLKVECHYFIINLSPIASALEYDHCQWHNNFGNLGFYFSYHGNLWTLMFFILEPVDAATELLFSFCHFPGEMEYCI